MSDDAANAEQQVPVADAADTHTEQATSQPLTGGRLRWWPLAALLLMMLGMRVLPELLDSPGMPILLMGFLGPAAMSVLVVVWWCFASRAPVKEKLLGVGGIAVAAAAGIALLHESLQGMWIAIDVAPAAAVAFGLPLLLLSRNRQYRLPVALLLTFITFGYWDLRQNEGVTGDFSTELLWRWEPTSEEIYLATLASENAKLTAPPTLPLVNLAVPDWPGFRGAERNSRINGLAINTDWSVEPPQQVWKRRIGPGWSSFSVVGQQLFTQEQRGENEVVLCLHADTGEVIWEYIYPSRFWESIAGAGPRATPTIADEGIFALGANGVLVCLNAADGSEIWKRDLREDADREPPSWGFSSSPLVTAGAVIVHAGGEDNKGIFAYDVNDGSIRWSVAAGDHTYSSAHLATIAAVPGVLMLCNDGLQFLNPQDGTLIWSHDWPYQNYRTLQPLIVDENTLLIATSLREGTRKLTVTRNEQDDWSIVDDWTTFDMKPDFNDFVEYDGHIYGFDNDIFACIDLKTGTRQWKKGRYGHGQVLLLADAGQLLVLSEKGQLVLLNARPDDLDEVARVPALDGKTWNHPVLIKDRLYIRNANEAACYQLPVTSVSDAHEVAELP